MKPVVGLSLILWALVVFTAPVLAGSTGSCCAVKGSSAASTSAAQDSAEAPPPVDEEAED